MYTCLSALLEPLKQASKDGIRLTDASGCERLVFPRLFGYIADIPEVAAVGGLKGHRSMHPCDQCLVGAASYAFVDCVQEMRRDHDLDYLHAILSS